MLGISGDMSHRTGL